HTLVQRRLLNNLSDQFGRSRIETCLLLFFAQVLLRLVTAAMREPAASLLPFLRQPKKHQRKSRCIPNLRIVDCLRVVDRLQDVFLRIRHHHFSWYLLPIIARHTTRFIKHLAGFYGLARKPWTVMSSMKYPTICPLELMRVGAVLKLSGGSIVV